MTELPSQTHQTPVRASMTSAGRALTAQTVKAQDATLKSLDYSEATGSHQRCFSTETSGMICPVIQEEGTSL